jgi:hypothetical protein
VRQKQRSGPGPRSLPREQRGDLNAVSANRTVKALSVPEAWNEQGLSSAAAVRQI